MKRVLILAMVAVILVGTMFAAPIQADTSLADGLYSVEFTFEGGSGRGGVESVQAEVKDGEIQTLYLTMTSPYYDYCLYYGEQYINGSGEGNSVFTVPYVEDSFLLTADTTAMSQPHEIDYTVTMDTAGMTKIGGGGSIYKTVAIVACIVLVCAIIAVIAVRASRKKT